MKRASTLILLLAGAALGQPGWDAVKNTVRITLHERVRVKGHHLRLSDIATVEGVDAGTVARAHTLRLGPVPGPGRARLLGRDSVANILRTATHNQLHVEVLGAAAVQIVPETVTLSSREVGTLARRFVYGAMGYRGNGIRIAPATRTPALETAAGRWSTKFEVVQEDPAAPLAGLIKLRVRAVVDGRPCVGVPVHLVIRRNQPVLVLKRRIPAGRPVLASDTAIETRTTDAASADALSSPDELEGLIARRTLSPGNVITKKDLRGRPVVFRNDTVTVHVRSGGLVVSTKGRVLENGSPGDTVPIRCGLERSIAQGRVIDSETVEILFEGANR